MPSSWSPSLRFELQFTGENINLWGEKLNAALTRADYAIAGWLTKPLTGDYALSTANGADDEARAAMIKFTGAGPFTVTVPPVSKSYVIWNACAGDLTVTTGAGATAVVRPGERCPVVCDGSGVYAAQATDMRGQKLTGLGAPTNGGDAVTKAYADGLAFAAVDLPGQAGSGGKFLTTDGSAASWAVVPTPDLATLGDVITGTSPAKAVTPDALAQAPAFRPLADAATIAWNTASVGPQAKVTLGGNRAMGAPSGLKDGWTYVLDVYQDATGGRTLSFDAVWDFGTAGAPTIVSAAGKKTSIVGIYSVDRGKLEAAVRWRQA